jgi:hypothetical protein
VAQHVDLVLGRLRIDSNCQHFESEQIMLKDLSENHVEEEEALPMGGTRQ